MHDLLAHVYHLVVRPFWHAPAAALAVGLALRGASRWAALAVLAGWLAAQYPVLTVSPDQPLYRLSGLAVILLIHARLAPVRLVLLALAASWWIAGAPFDVLGLAGCVPVFLGVWAALALTRRIATPDRGGAGIGAALALAACLLLAGGAPHWVRAALVPAVAGVALIGAAGAALPLAYATMLTACLAVVASDRGRFVPVDLAALAPLLVWFLASRIKRVGPVLAAGLATVLGAGVTLGAIRLLAMR